MPEDRNAVPLADMLADEDNELLNEPGHRIRIVQAIIGGFFRSCKL